MNAIILALAGALMMGLGSPFYKKCTEKIGRISFEKFSSNPLGLLFSLVFNKFFLIGVGLGCIGWVLWLSGLTEIEAMVAGPVLAAMYISNLILARLWLKESLSKREMGGIIGIILGILVLAIGGVK